MDDTAAYTAAAALDADTPKALCIASEHPEGETQLYASWQGGQYLQSMFSSHHNSLNNNRYPQLTWTKLEDVVKPAA